LLDDKNLAVRAVKELAIVAEGRIVVQELINAGVLGVNICFSGHSLGKERSDLGGAAAMILATVYGGTCVVFNAAAPPTAPTILGPGPGKAVHYHIVGDMISSHMANSAATVIRIDQGDEYGFAGTARAHGTVNLWKAGRVVDAEYEQVKYVKWGVAGGFHWTQINAFVSGSTYVMNKTIKLIISTSPIPDTKAWLESLIKVRVSRGERLNM
jgi:hypothetical protein